MHAYQIWWIVVWPTVGSVFELKVSEKRKRPHIRNSRTNKWNCKTIINYVTSTTYAMCGNRGDSAQLNGLAYTCIRKMIECTATTLKFLTFLTAFFRAVLIKFWNSIFSNSWCRNVHSFLLHFLAAHISILTNRHFHVTIPMLQLISYIYLKLLVSLNIAVTGKQRSF